MVPGRVRSLRTYRPIRPYDASTTSSRVFRGGSWDADARSLRAAGRGGNRPGYRDDNLGFRLAEVGSPASSQVPGAGTRSGLASQGGGALWSRLRYGTRRRRFKNFRRVPRATFIAQNSSPEPLQIPELSARARVATCPQPQPCRRLGFCKAQPHPDPSPFVNSMPRASSAA